MFSPYIFYPLYQGLNTYMQLTAYIIENFSI